VQSAAVLFTEYGFDVQLSKLYTRPVYNRFKGTLKSNTAFNIQEDTLSGTGNYLVTHRKADTVFPWIEHSFRVRASHDTRFPERSTFECECKTWEHTGNNCYHKKCLEIKKLLNRRINNC
jgi:hypothetical protein